MPVIEEHLLDGCIKLQIEPQKVPQKVPQEVPLKMPLETPLEVPIKIQPKQRINEALTCAVRFFDSVHLINSKIALQPVGNDPGQVMRKP